MGIEHGDSCFAEGFDEVREPRPQRAAYVRRLAIVDRQAKTFVLHEGSGEVAENVVDCGSERRRHVGDSWGGLRLAVRIEP